VDGEEHDDLDLALCSRYSRRPQARRGRRATPRSAVAAAMSSSSADDAALERIRNRMHAFDARRDADERAAQKDSQVRDSLLAGAAAGAACTAAAGLYFRRSPHVVKRITPPGCAFVLFCTFFMPLNFCGHLVRGRLQGTRGQGRSAQQAS
jgi:hypothetical protein